MSRDPDMRPRVFVEDYGLEVAATVQGWTSG